MDDYLTTALYGGTVRSFLRVLDDYWQIIMDLCVINVYTEMYVLDGADRTQTVFDSSSFTLFENRKICCVNASEDTEPVEIVFDGKMSLVIQPLPEDDTCPERMFLDFFDGKLIVVY